MQLTDTTILRGCGFRVAFDPGAGGITSLKRENATHDTDYVLEGGSLGDVVVRHRIGPADWREAASASTAPTPRRRKGSVLLEAGHGLVDIQRRLRHADIGTTVGTYLQPTSAADERAAATLERLVLEGS